MFVQYGITSMGPTNDCDLPQRLATSRIVSCFLNERSLTRPFTMNVGTRNIRSSTAMAIIFAVTDLPIKRRTDSGFGMLSIYLTLPWPFLRCQLHGAHAKINLI